MPLSDTPSPLHARPDGSVVWDTWLKKQPDRSDELRTRLRHFAVDVDDPAAIAAHIAEQRPFADLAQALAITALRWHALAALPVLEQVIEQYALERADELLAPCVRMLQAIHAEPAVDSLLARLKIVDVRDAVERHASRWPIWMLRKLLALKPARNHPAAELLLRLLDQHPEWTEPLQQACDDSEKQTLARLLEPPEGVEYAPLSLLPEVLRQPPWKHRAALPAIPTLTLQTIPRTPVLHWAHYPLPLDPPDPRGRYYVGDHRTQVEMVFAKVSASAPAAAQGWDLPRKALWNLGLSADAIETALREQRVSPDLFGPKRYDYYEPELFLWHLPPPLAVSVLEHCPIQQLNHFPWYDGGFARLLHWLGPTALTGFRRWVPRPTSAYMPLFQCIEWSELVLDMAQLYCRNRWRRDDACKWLQAYPQTAASTLLPLALGAPGADRDTARQTLRALAAAGQSRNLIEVAADYGKEAESALAILLAIAPHQFLPDALPVLPKKLYLRALPPLLLRDDGRAVPVEAHSDALMCLALSTSEQPYAGLLALQESLTAESLARFGRALLTWWLDQDTPSKERWMFAVQGLIGNDETARMLATALRQWRAALIRVRAYDAMDMLAQIGSDAALMHLHSLGAQTRYGDISTRARKLIHEIAEARGLSTDGLADRSVPDLGLGDDGGLELDYGPRRFSVHFDAFLLPHVRDAGGQRLKDLPKPKASDDATLAAAATQQYKELKNQARSLAALQLKRLEQAMCTQRRWTQTDFRQLLLAHPLLQHLVRRLLWAAYDDDDVLAVAFRAAEDLTLADRRDQACSLPDTMRISIPHPVQLPADVLRDFQQVYADYAIGQPFPQLAREVYRCAPEAGPDLPEWIGRQVTVGSLMGLEQRGWSRSVGDGGMIDALVKPLPGDLAMELRFCGDGWFVGGPPDTRQVQEILAVCLVDRRSRASGSLSLTQLDAVSYSELLRDLSLMAWFKA